MSQAIAGTAFVSANGKRYRLVGELSYRISGETREAKNGADGFHGHKSKFMNGMIKMKLRNDGTYPLSELADMVDVTVQAQLANGKTVIGRNMFQSGEPPTADAEEAEIEITFEGPDVRD
ncbi:MAG: phage tail tube protein [Phenylobacterium sp.]|nr:phage tail tube protein [Phenylobacterium sp.]